MLWMGQEQPPEPKRLLKDLRSPLQGPRNSFRDHGTPTKEAPPKDPSTPLRTQGAPQRLGESLPGLKMPS